MKRKMYSVLVTVVFLLSVNEVISQCPPFSGIYLTHDGTCYTNGSYFFDADIKGASNSIMCVLPDTDLTDGEWVNVTSKSSVDCSSSTNPLRCNEVFLPNANISLYIDGSITPFDDGWYKCCLPTNCSDPNTNIIFANIFRWVQIENITVDLPSDKTALPQTYTLHAIKIGSNDHDPFLHKANWYYVSGSSSAELCTGSRASYSCTFMYGDGMSVDYGNGRWDYTLTVTWNGETIASGVLSQSNNNGDHVFRFYLDFGHIHHNPVKRNRDIFVTVPATAPSSLTEVNKTATTITVSWTALNSSDADGYVVNVTSDIDTVQTVQVEGSSNNAITLNGLRGGTTYSITVRAYQQLLGPASSTISVQTLPVINSINWTLVSSITQLNNTQYRIDCLRTTEIINPSTDVYWLVKGVMKSSSNYSLIDVLTYNNTLLVYPDPLGVSVNVSCIAMIGGVNYNQSVILHGMIIL
uniref:Fibronectin type-III domain-containing protein n=1 Tax=Amphimedon queenslandica TaxID=400682 RepID=A0A1X7SSX0_AMPQE